MDETRRVLKNTCIGIVKDKIAYLGDFNENFNAVKVIEGSNKVAIPGLIDSHAHSGHRLLRNMNEGMMSKKMHDLYSYIYYGYTTQKFWFSEAMLAGIEKLKFGITTGVSYLGSDTRFDEISYAEAHIEGMLGIGIRDVLCVGPPNPPFPKKFLKWDNMKVIDSSELSLEDSFSYIRNVVRKFNRVNSEFTYCYPATSFPESGLGMNMEDIRTIYKEIKDISEEYGTRIHSHSYAGEIKFTKENFDFYNENVFVANCVEPSNEEIKILADLGVSLCSSPYSEVNTLNRCPIVKLIDAGVNTTLCTDASDQGSTYDLFEIARMGVNMERCNFQNNHLIMPEKALEMITINAAKAIGLDDIIGSLEIGKKADITFIDTEKPHLYPLWQNPINMIYQVSGQDVNTVIVNGRVLMEERILTQLDENKILVSAQNEAQKILLRESIKEYLEPLNEANNHKIF